MTSVEFVLAQVSLKAIATVQETFLIHVVYVVVME
jgi:hypothetical protein